MSLQFSAECKKAHQQERDCNPDNSNQRCTGEHRSSGGSWPPLHHVTDKEDVKTNKFLGKCASEIW